MLLLQAFYTTIDNIVDFVFFCVFLGFLDLNSSWGYNVSRVEFSYPRRITDDLICRFYCDFPDIHSREPS